MIEPNRFLDAYGKCRACGSVKYTVRELTLNPRQQWRCYSCFDKVRFVMTTFTLDTLYVKCAAARISVGSYPGTPKQIGWHVMGDCGEGYEENIGSPTVNLADYSLFAPAGYVFIKITAEYVGWLDALIKAGIVEDTGTVVRAGYVARYATLCKVLLPELLEPER